MNIDTDDMLFAPLDERDARDEKLDAIVEEINADDFLLLYAIRAANDDTTIGDAVTALAVNMSYHRRPK